jgi:phosphinothricin acetyltransferase
VIGYTGTDTNRAKAAYDTMVEATIYLAVDAKDAESARDSTRRCWMRRHPSTRRRPTLPNPVSVTLHERFGFTRISNFSHSGRRLVRYGNVLLDGTRAKKS